MTENAAQNVTPSPLLVLLQLGRRARHAADANELGFIAVNETHQLVPYRQAVLWLADGGVTAVSGVSRPDANSPYAQWMDRVLRRLSAPAMGAHAVQATDLPADLAAEWSEWLPAAALFLPLLSAGGAVTGAWLLARDEPWQEDETLLLGEWADLWSHAWQAATGAGATTRWRGLLRQLLDVGAHRAALGRLGHRLAKPRWRRALAARWRRALAPRHWRRSLVALWRVPRRRYATLALLVLLFPVRLTVLAPGELVPAHPAVIRAPVDGVIDQVLVQPNQTVEAGARLFALDRTTLDARLKVAQQSLATAQAEYRQQAQTALFDSKAKAQLALVMGTIAERQAELEYLKQQIERSQVTAPRAGTVLFDDPTELIGKPVQTGERLATVADAGDIEVEAWVAPGDVLAFEPGATVTLYLNTTPLAPVSAQLRYLAHEASERPDGTFAYRLRADLAPDAARERIGLKGTAKVAGRYVPFAYWMLRRPLALARQWIGF